MADALLSGAQLLALDDFGVGAADLPASVAAWTSDPKAAGAGNGTEPNDIAAAYSNAIAIARVNGATVVAGIREPPTSLLQPRSLVSSSARVLLLSHGRVLYHGPASALPAYFSNTLGLQFQAGLHLGEQCACLVNDPEGCVTMYCSPDTAGDEGASSSRGTRGSVSAMHAVWDQYKKQQQPSSASTAVVAPITPSASSSSSPAPAPAASPLPFGRQLPLLCTRRVQVTARTPGLFLVKAIGGVLGGLLLGALLYNPAIVNIAPKGSTAFLFVMFVLSFGIAEVG